jgi:hypothetical protein
MKNLLFLVCIILISCNQNLDNELIKAEVAKATPYEADTTILIQGGLLDVAIAYRKGNSKVDSKLKWSAKKDTVFVEGLSLFNVFNMQLADAKKQFLLEQAYKTSLFVYVKGSEMPVELEDWKNYYSDYKLNMMNTKMRNIEPYNDFDRNQFVVYSDAEFRQGIEQNKTQFSDNILINTIGEMNSEIYPVITETYFRMTADNKVFHIIFKSPNGC